MFADASSLIPSVLQFWFNSTADAANGYEHILQPPRMKQDICYWMNMEAARQAGGEARVACINTAIEATTLNDRACCCLLSQDVFIRDHITEDDYLVVSVGGNDVALAPLACTVANMCALVWAPLPSSCTTEHGFACPPNIGIAGDLGCIGCGVPNCISSSLCACPPGLGYMADLMGNRVENYVRSLCSRRKPKKVVVCMIYHLDERSTGSWADGALTCLCYDCNPGRLQGAIEAAFRVATSRIVIPGGTMEAAHANECL